VLCPTNGIAARTGTLTALPPVRAWRRQPETGVVHARGRFSTPALAKLLVDAGQALLNVPLADVPAWGEEVTQ
jgi:hypothetical protein